MPFAAGAMTGLGIGSVLLLSSTVSQTYPGHWGDQGVYDYYYSSGIGTKVYDVHCYCMRFNPCSCEKQTNASYFENLDPFTYITRNGSKNHVAYYINGTLANGTESSASTDSGSGSNNNASNTGSKSQPFSIMTGSGSSAVLIVAVAALIL